MRNKRTAKILSIILCAAVVTGHVNVYAAAEDAAETISGALQPGSVENADAVLIQDDGQDGEQEKSPGTVEEEAGSETENEKAGAPGAEENGAGTDGTEEGEEENETPSVGVVRIVDRYTGAEIPEDTVTFSVPAYYDNGAFIFDGASVGDTVEYSIETADGGVASGNFTLGSYDMTVQAEIIVKTAVSEGTVSIRKTYSDSGFLISDYVDIPSDYTGKTVYTLVSGEGTVSVDEEGRTAVLAAGDAVVNMFFPGDKKYSESEVTVNIAVEKYDLGEIREADITWDSLTAEYSEDGLYTVTGSFDAAGNDRITMTAVVEAENHAVGESATTVRETSFSGADNYSVSFTGDGPVITITEPASAPGEETPVSVNAAYGPGNPVNSLYFREDRELTITALGESFNPDLLSVAVTVDGSPLSLADIRSGADGAWLETDGEKDAEGATSYIICFGGDAVEKEYTVNIRYNGETVEPDGPAAGNFVVDNVAPVLSVSYTDQAGHAVEAGTDSRSPFFSNGSVTAEISVADTFFSKENVDIAVSAKDAAGNDISGSAYPADRTEAVKTGQWAGDGNTWTFSMDPFTEDANYGLEAGCADMAGNRAEGCETRFFTVDGTAPEVAITVTTFDGEKKDYERVLTEKEKLEGLIGYVFDTFSKKVTLESEAEDETSGIASVQYYLVDVDHTADAEFEQEAQLDKLEWEDYKEGIVIDTDRIAVIFEKVTDRAGNITYISSGGGIIVDTKEPGVPVITIKGAEADIYSGDVVFDVYVTDPDNGGEGVFSGIKRVSYTVADPASGKTAHIGETEKDRPRVRDVSEKITVPSGQFNGNGFVFAVTAEDYAGNTKTEEKAFSIDATVPVITASLDDSGVRNGHYFNETRVFTAVFTERNFDSSLATLTVSAGGEENTWSMKALMDGEASGHGITIRSVDDTEKDVLDKERTDSRKITYEIRIGDGDSTDMDYSGIRLACEDRAGNRAAFSYTDYPVITVDKVAPAVGLSFSDSGKDVTSMVSGRSEAPYFTNTPVTARVTVRERNFSPAGLDISLSQTDYRGNGVNVYDGGNISAMKEKAGWSAEGTEYRKAMPQFSGEANYGLAAEYTDLAGNSTQASRTRYFTVDSTSPEGSIVVDSDDGTARYSSFSEQAVIRFISRYSIVLTNEAEDATSGMANVQYYRYTPPRNVTGRFSALSLQQLQKARWKEWQEGTPVLVEPDSQAVIYAKFTDRAGNILYVSTEGAMIADRTAPERPDIRITIGEPENGIFNSDVPVSYTAEDRVSGNTYAGLRRVTVQVLNGGTVTQSETRDFRDKTARQRTAAGNITVNAGRNNSNNVTISVTAEDYAGNISASEQTVKIDVTAPRIEVSYDDNDPANGRYYNRTRTATVRVYERNFSPSGVDMDITSSLGAGASVSGWSSDGNAGISDDSVNTCTVTYDADSDYTFTMSVTDRAGNTASYGQTDSFTIDKTRPEISVRFDHDGGRYFNTVRTATITVKERNFDPSDFSGDVSASLDGKPIPAPGISGWYGSGEYHTAEIVFSEDGDYSFRLGDTDLAGNAADSYSQELFTIDRTSPKVEFSGVENGSANKGKVEPSAGVTDRNLDSGSIHIYLTGYRHEQKDVTQEMAGPDGTFSYKGFERIAENDDVYTLTVVAGDLAGNRTEKSIRFSVNRFGSNYHFDSDTAAFLEKYYHKDAGDIVIYETNVDALKIKGVTVIRDGKTTVLGPEAVKAEDISKDGEWKQYRYSLPGTLFTEEGIYEVMLDSEDEAGNLQSNKMKESPITFVIDRTAPGIVITGIEDGQVYNEKERSLTLVVTDNYAAEKAELVINGKTVGQYDAKALDAGNGKAEYMIKEDKDWKVISAAAYDAAGNRAETDNIRILLTTDFMTRLIGERSPLLAFPPALIAALVAAGLVRVRKRKAG